MNNEDRKHENIKKLSPRSKYAILLIEDNVYKRNKEIATERRHR